MISFEYKTIRQKTKFKYPSRVERDFPEFVEAVGDLDLSKNFEKMD